MTSAHASGSNLSMTSPNRPNLGRCLINVLTQKQWSLDVPLCIRYQEGEGASSDHHQEVTGKILPIRWPHPLSCAERLPSYQVLNIQAEYIDTGKYDKNLLYDTAQLISFPGMKVDSDSCATIQLYTNKEESIKMSVTVPESFPDYLVNRPIFVEILSRVEYLGIESSLTLCIMVIG